MHTSVAAVSLTPGNTLNNRYFIERELKRGGFGIVYVARDLQLHSRLVVIKVLLEHNYKSEYVVQKFHQEVEALSRIDHPGVVGIIDSGELADGKQFIVMQYVNGTTLRSVMRPEGVDLSRSADIIRQIGRALTAAHEKGIFHRDLKPENVMLQNLGHGEEQVKVIDFGIAKVKDSVVAPNSDTNISAGTVSYMAPEQLCGRTVSACTDVYALGQIAYEMLTGRKPFNPQTGFELLEMQRAGVRINPRDLRPGLPAAAQASILRALSFAPDSRYARARDFGDELSRALITTALTSESIDRTGKPQFAPPPTELIPKKDNSALTPAKTVIATFPMVQLAAGASNRASKQANAHSKFALALAGILLLFGLMGTWYWYREGAITSKSTNTTNSSLAERHLSYWLTVQKMREGQPYQNEFDSSGQEIFENGWKFRLNVFSPQAGYLYLLNEGPSERGDTTFNLLFPAPSANSGSPYVPANQKTQTGWMVFDENQGTEKFWMVWSADAVSELEAVRQVVNEKDRGAINDRNQADAVQKFLMVHHSAAKAESNKDSTKKQTNVKAGSNVLVDPIELEHH